MGSVFVSGPESIAEGIRAISFFRISVRKILNSWKLRVGDPLLRPQNLGLKGLTGKIFQNKELAEDSWGARFPSDESRDEECPRMRTVWPLAAVEGKVRCHKMGIFSVEKCRG